MRTESMPVESHTSKKAYCAPRLKKLTPEQAKLLLLGQANRGDNGARDLLNVLFAAPDGLQVFFGSEGERQGGTVTEDTPRAHWLIVHISMVRKALRQGFRRLI